uniref:Fibronectin type-III domain-containing protein n=1 Tax=Steinernema glaseri TaxID=37863 RepID=A0A1I7ZZR0_9BILA
MFSLWTFEEGDADVKYVAYQISYVQPKDPTQSWKTFEEGDADVKYVACQISYVQPKDPTQSWKVSKRTTGLLF